MAYNIKMCYVAYYGIKIVDCQDSVHREIFYINIYLNTQDVKIFESKFLKFHQIINFRRANLGKKYSILNRAIVNSFFVFLFRPDVYELLRRQLPRATTYPTR